MAEGDAFGRTFGARGEEDYGGVVGADFFVGVGGFGIVVYSLTLTALVIDLVMSTNITWFSTMYGLNYLVGQGYAVLAISVITVILLLGAMVLYVRQMFKIGEVD